MVLINKPFYVRFSFFSYTGDFMKKVPSVTCVPLDRQMVSIERVYLLYKISCISLIYRIFCMNYTIHFIVRGLLSFSSFLFLLFLSEILYKDIQTKKKSKKYEISVLKIGRMFLKAKLFLFPINCDGGGGRSLVDMSPLRKHFLYSIFYVYLSQTIHDFYTVRFSKSVRTAIVYRGIDGQYIVSQSLWVCFSRYGRF